MGSPGGYRNFDVATSAAATHCCYIPNCGEWVGDSLVLWWGLWEKGKGKGSQPYLFTRAFVASLLTRCVCSGLRSPCPMEYGWYMSTAWSFAYLYLHTNKCSSNREFSNPPPPCWLTFPWKINKRLAPTVAKMSATGHGFCCCSGPAPPPRPPGCPKRWGGRSMLQGALRETGFYL